MVYELWQRLRQLEHRVRPGCRPHYLRGRCRVIDVRPCGDRLQVTYYDADQNLRSISARFVIMAGSKHVAKHVLFDLEHWDYDKLQAMNQLETLPYLVVNVLLNAPIERDFYDCFLLGDGIHYPMNGEDLEHNPIVTDMLRGDNTSEGPRSVLTLVRAIAPASASSHAFAARCSRVCYPPGATYAMGPCHADLPSWAHSQWHRRDGCPAHRQ